MNYNGLLINVNQHNNHNVPRRKTLHIIFPYGARLNRMLSVYHINSHPIPLPENHRFPQEKYALLLQSLLADGVLRPQELLLAPHATRDELILAHTPAYVDSILDGTVDPKMMRQIGLPWSPALVQRSCASVGGTIAAGRDALRDGIACNLGGGTHHALANEGQGFCVFNDFAVAFLKLRAEGSIRRAAVIDLDVHQGNGTAGILGGRDDVFLLSIHGQKNYPFRKVPSTLDVDLPDGAGDEAYLDALDAALPAVLAFQPELIFYQAGVDPLDADRLGRLALSMNGLALRDRAVFHAARAAEIPLALTLGGGYARPIALTVQAHVQTYRILKQMFPI